MNAAAMPAELHVRHRRALHAGSWYSSSAPSLRRSLTRWLESSLLAPSQHPRPFPRLRAIIAPHAGYSYSGRIAAYAYNAVDTSRISRVFVLGPSHHVYMRDKCVLTTATILETPLGSLSVDVATINKLYELSPNTFMPFDMDADEQEHSIEMHLPYLRHIFGEKEVSIVPIVVGNLSEAMEVELGTLLAPWLADESTLFVISSDFCHWGQRFNYTHYTPGDGDIWQSIEKLDRQGMDAIESCNHGSYCNYQKNTDNTICGRHAIAILIIALAHLREIRGLEAEIKFVKYDQSSKCMNMDDSSVSYASAWAYF